MAAFLEKPVMTMKQRIHIEDVPIDIVQPESPEDVEALWDAFCNTAENLPFEVPERFKKWALENPRVMVLFYANDSEECSGWLIRTMPKDEDAAELNACVHKNVLEHFRPHPTLQGKSHRDIRRVFAASMYAIELKVLDETFFKFKKPYVFVRFNEENRFAKGFAWKWGFKKQGKSPNGQHLIYTLTLEDYLQRREKVTKRNLTLNR